MQLVHVSYWLAVFATSFMALAVTVPLWFGRQLSDDHFQLHGLFYSLKCLKSHCKAHVRILSSESIALTGRDWSADIIVIPVLAVLSSIFYFSAMMVLQAIVCGYRSAGKKTHKGMALVTGLSVASGLLSSLTVIMTIYACAEYYSDNHVDYVSEFPWSLFLFLVADVIVIITSILFALIACDWDKYKQQYGHRRFSRSRSYNSDDSVLGRKSHIKQKWPGYDNISFADSGVSTTKSTSGKSGTGSDYFDFSGISRSAKSEMGSIRSVSTQHTYDVLESDVRYCREEPLDDRASISIPNSCISHQPSAKSYQKY